MESEELLAEIDSLDPDNTDVAEALAFIRLVVKNNPKKTVAQIAKRSDIQEALAEVRAWMKTARKAVDDLVEEIPKPARPTVEPQAKETIDKVERDTALTADRIGEWRTSEEPAESWVAKIVLRMRWFKDWLRKQAEWATLGAPYKRWVSRLDERTCSFCRSLHGVVLPVGASFAVEARKSGYKRVYGGLYAPPLHPRCRCDLVPVTQAEYNKIRRAA